MSYYMTEEEIDQMIKRLRGKTNPARQVLHLSNTPVPDHHLFSKLPECPSVDWDTMESAGIGDS